MSSKSLEIRARNLVKFENGSKIANKWTIMRMLGTGAFGVVYKVADTSYDLFAMKTEKYTPRNVLKVEVKVLSMAKKRKMSHFLKLFETGTCKGGVRGEYLIYIVMELAGSSLDALRRLRPNRRFTLLCALTIGVQFIGAIEELHELGYQHRDIKAANFAIGHVPEGTEDQHRRKSFYIIDFGLCRAVIDSSGNLRHPRKAAPFRGTVRYAPLNCHILRETCRKDDLESWLYSQIEYTRGSLPWRDLNNIVDVGLYKERCRHDIGLGELMGGCPRQYIKILRYLDSLRYYDKPDYKHICDLLKDAGKIFGQFKPTYDWIDEGLRGGNGNAEITERSSNPSRS
ncbi:hypothetical protein L596_017397 [Steinernema carpocapsae]|uniref:Protein kinase domain-containing protein n=1 Tax=Steinernema carpocapsae TaxID=34508 RepID=A0A4U5N1T3_STECR|nr:hypothetical protein L596_017397 [Steinernema carpocapsae]